MLIFTKQNLLYKNFEILFIMKTLKSISVLALILCLFSCSEDSNSIDTGDVSSDPVPINKNLELLVSDGGRVIQNSTDKIPLNFKVENFESEELKFQFWYEIIGRDIQDSYLELEELGTIAENEKITISELLDFKGDLTPNTNGTIHLRYHIEVIDDNVVTKRISQNSFDIFKTNGIENDFNFEVEEMYYQRNNSERECISYFKIRIDESNNSDFDLNKYSIKVNIKGSDGHENSFISTINEEDFLLNDYTAFKDIEIYTEGVMIHNSAIYGRDMYNRAVDYTITLRNDSGFEKSVTKKLYTICPEA